MFVLFLIDCYIILIDLEQNYVDEPRLNIMIGANEYGWVKLELGT